MREVLLRTALIGLALVVFDASAAAQAPDVSAKTGQHPVQSRPAAQNGANVDDELNITERRIIESDYEASTSVEIGDETARGLSLRVGVGVTAREIDVLLRNVHGRFRFTATLDAILKRLNPPRGLSPAEQ